MYCSDIKLKILNVHPNGGEKPSTVGQGLLEHNGFIDTGDSLRADFLRGLSGEQGDQIVNRGTVRDLKSGVVLFRQGDQARRLFFVLEGRLKLGKLHEQGKEVLIRYIGPGELTVMIAVLHDREYPVTAEAVSTTRVVGWDKAAMCALMAEHPEVHRNMLRNSLYRLEDLQNRYLELYAEQVERRIARSLLRIMKQSGRRSGDELLIDFPISSQELADYTGTTCQRS